MKKIFFASLLGMFLFSSSCNQPAAGDKQLTEQEQKNLAASNAIMQAFETGDASKLDSVVAPDFLDHTDRGDMKGIDSLKAAVAFVHANFKDMKTEKIHEVADGDYVYVWSRYTGTSDGTMGMPVGPYSMTAIELSKYKDGKAVEHWNFMEAQDVMKMMASQPMPAMDDTMKK